MKGCSADTTRACGFPGNTKGTAAATSTLTCVGPDALGLDLTLATGKMFGKWWERKLTILGCPEEVQLLQKDGRGDRIVSAGMGRTLG